MTDKRSGLSSSISVRATISTTVAGRNAPASSCARVVSRTSRSTRGAGAETGAGAGAGAGVAALEGDLRMILANVRGRLRAQDFHLVALALARGDAGRRARYERLLLEEGPDRLLDEPGLLVALRHTLRAAGVDDCALAEYLAALLLEFGDHDRHTRIRRTDDERYHYLVDVVAELTGLDDTGERGFLLRVHLGNYSLWLAGLFPDYIAARRS